MSVTPEEAQAGPAESPLFTVAFVLLVIVIIGLAYYVTVDSKPAADASADPGRALAERIQKVGSVHIQLASANASHAPHTGEEVFNGQCSACHGTGVAGAPKFGDAAAWAPRIAQGQQALEQAPIKGYTGKTGVMPPQSGGPFSDYEIMRAVVYMANAAGAKFEEPPPPPAAGEGAVPAAAPAPAPGG